MSRKSRYADDGGKQLIKCVPWKAGVYIRLSREDEDKKDGSSQSVVSQRKIIDRFLSYHKDIEVFEYFIDDGYSGTNMNRPSFQRMKDAFERGTINCIIVKDLSRFARNDEEAGRYIYVIFPFYKIRFISVNDRVDSVENPSSIETLEIPFKNIMHSEYSRDLSKKVRSASDIRRRRGEFIGSFCSYGYKKDPNDIHHLIIDEEAAEVVRFIFQRYIETENFLKIAKELSAKNILTPLAYKVVHGQNLKVPKKQHNPTLWRNGTVKRILENKTYLGHIIQGQHRTISYKNKKTIPVDESEWVIVENTHDPIVTQEVFDRVKAMILKNKKVTNKRTSRKHLFAGKLFCGECGASLSLTQNTTSQFNYYYCENAYLKKGFCSPKRTRNDKLEKAVLDTLNGQLKVCSDSLQLLNILNSHRKRLLKENVSITEQRRSVIAKLQNDKTELYGKYKEALLTKEQYISEKARIETSIQELENLIAELNREEDIKDFVYEQPIFTEFIKSGKFVSLTREIIEKFIDKILVYSPTEIEVHFTFSDEFEKINEFIKTNADWFASKAV